MGTEILLVEDDRDIASLVADFLSRNGMTVHSVRDGAGVTRYMASNSPDLVVLDLMLPGGEDGLSIASRLRQRGDVPIIMLTAMGEDTDRVVGLEIGADDYVTKPFNPRELLARIRAVLRRSSVGKTDRRVDDMVLCFEGWRLNTLMRQLVDSNGVQVPLTSAEFDLLLAFCERPRRVLSREILLDLTRGPNGAPFDRSIDVLVSRLRQKIESDIKNPKYLTTIRLEGYLFTPVVKRI